MQLPKEKLLSNHNRCVLDTVKDDTQMTGTMPAEVCNLRSGELTTLKVDCSASGGTAEIECDYPSCCTVCTLI
jgi:hypothetical protein